MRAFSLFLGICGVVLTAPASAEVTAVTDAGFVSRNQVEVPVSPAAAWRALVLPKRWWNGDHTYSGDADNLSIVPQVGGCFCERIPATATSRAGGIEHMRVLYVVPRSTLRLSGGLGPLQSEAATGVLTITLEPAGQGTRITFEYVVGGYIRTPVREIAPLVDGVVGEQLARLAAHLAE